MITIKAFNCYLKITDNNQIFLILRNISQFYEGMILKKNQVQHIFVRDSSKKKMTELFISNLN
jgi:hypothetical protein